METLAAVDALATERVVVYGSLPPKGKDLDLLVRPAAERELRRGLAGRGWIVRGTRCALFHDCTAEVVEFVAAGALGLDEGRLGAVFEQATVLDGMTFLCRPAPAHALLILARRLTRGGGRLAPKHRDRIGQLLGEDSRAWEHAFAEAPAWGAQLALAGLRQAYEIGLDMSAAQCAAGIREELSARGRSRLRARLGALRAVAPLPPRRRGFIVTLSGLDGAGKSTQAAALREALEALGFRADVHWTSLAAHPPLLLALTRIANGVLALATRATSGGPAGNAAAAGDAGAGTAPVGATPRAGAATPADTPAKRLRRSSRLVGFGWTSALALGSGIAHRRATRPHLVRGRVVICDRYVLDSKVQLRYEYGESGRFAFQALLLRALSPRPDRAFLLDVSAETASARKADYPLPENVLRSQLYHEEAGKLGVLRLDGGRPRPEVCAALATEVFSALA